MTPHDWKPAPPGYVTLKDGDENTVDCTIFPFVVGLYVCARCGEEAYVRRIRKSFHLTDARVSECWFGDCDNVIIRKVHRL